MDSLPPGRTPLYNHSLPALEAWLRGLGAQGESGRRERWLLSRAGWSATLTLDVEELAVEWQGGGPERRFPYRLSRADVEAAILAGP
ncbi:MAG: DUF3143 domain-containing protein [Cyanobacteriota bacterium]|nr:DUF3143 domain-containing protein [Cyanobacteriota bacterium]